MCNSAFSYLFSGFQEWTYWLIEALEDMGIDTETCGFDPEYFHGYWAKGYPPESAALFHPYECDSSTGETPVFTGNL